MKKLLMALTLVGAAVVGNIQAMETASGVRREARTTYGKHKLSPLQRLIAAEYAYQCLAAGEGEHPNASTFPQHLRDLLAFRSASSTDTSRTTTPGSGRSQGGDPGCSAGSWVCRYPRCNKASHQPGLDRRSQESVAESGTFTRRVFGAVRLSGACTHIP